ncbi:hypothetical protein D1872_188670 [compost metagenome]
MIINILFGFIIPWIFGMWLYKKDKKIVLIIAPLGSVLSYTFNLLGHHLELWSFKPILKTKQLSAFPLDIGLYPVISSYLIYLVQKRVANPYLILLIFSLVTTFLEYSALVFGGVSYNHDWNIFWTFWSYALPYFIIYRFYIELKKIKVFN